MRIPLLLAALVLAGSTTLLASAPEPLTRANVRTMPQEALTRRLFGDLGPIMLPIFSRGRPGRTPTRPLDSLVFLTVPTASYSPGLCRSSTVTVHFDPDGPLAGADTPVRPTGIEVSQFYVIADLARLRRDDELGQEGRARLATTCAAIDPRQTWNISAPDEHMLVADVQIFVDLVEAARAGPVGVSLNCPGPADQPPTTEAACRQIVAQLDIRRISMVARCNSPMTHAAGCFWLDLGEKSVRFESDSITAPPSRVVVEDMIIIADERID